MAKMNYGAWFYNQHRYRKNSRGTIESFNDTKWATINERLTKLIDMGSSLLEEQPFMVNGNQMAFRKLIDLMGRSNYTFDDLDDALKETYRVSLQNTMSRNLVNTHAVMFHGSNVKDSNVVSESFTHYKIIEAPYDQLHFGARDEFIRQKLQEMHTTQNKYFVPINKFNSSEFVKILDFSIMCTVNGYFCNDCLIAMDDKGFKFKIGWPYSSDVDFIVYKLDHAQVISTNVNTSYIEDNGIIPYSVLGVQHQHIGLKCIVNIYDKNFTKTSPSAPNFGIFTKEGVKLINLQKITLDTLKRQGTENVSIDIYALKFFHEVPDLYPAVNYVDILDSKIVYDERYEYIKNLNGDKIVSSSTSNYNYLETCTPPIAIDRNTTYSFDIIVECLALYDKMMVYNNDMFTVGQGLTYKNEYDFYNKYLPMLENVYYNLLHLFGSYQQGAILTSLVESERINKFEELITNMKNLIDLRDFSKVQSFVFDELYGSNYKSTVLYITEPFRSEKLETFSNMTNMTNNYFGDGDNSTRFNRPISPECFITLRYHRDDECWLFDYPEIKHFHGIGNTFYIDTKLTGTEIFKFFVLYSDTESPDEPNIEHFDLDTVLDFDLFSKEVDKHLGCIRYWDAENRLMKISKMLYGKYDDETVVQVLSKMLKRKVNGEDIINVYPSEINYEDSNKTTDNLDDYTVSSERAPFSINFLFYTLSMLNNNVDKLQEYFYKKLVNNKYDNRYADIDISSVISDEKYPVNYAEFCISPAIPGETTVAPDGQAYAFYGLPLLLNSLGGNIYEPYRYVLNVYKPDIQYPIISENGLNHDFYTSYDDITKPGYDGQIISYHDDIYLATMVTKYLTSVYDYISELQTNYKTSFNQTSTISEALKTINHHITKINEFLQNANIVTIQNISDPNDIINILNDNALIDRLELIQSLINNISNVITYPTTNIVSYINSTVLNTLKFVYVTTGFDNDAMNRARMLYIHLKKINTPMNAYQFKKWINNIDLHILQNLDDMLAENENYNLGNGIFYRMYEILNDYKTRIIDGNLLDNLDTMIKDLSGTIKTDHINPLIEYCDDMINSVIFDIYVINDINFNNNIAYNTKPAYVVIKVLDDPHVVPPIGTQLRSSHGLIFQPIIDSYNDGYLISSLSNICEYAFFDGTQLTNLTMNILDIDGSVIGTQTVSIDFTRLSSTADKVNTFDQITNVNTSSIEFQNNHETFEVVDDLVVNEKHAKMNYELLVGNHFTPLEHVEELILEPETWLQGSVDRLIMDNQTINRMSMIEFGHRKCSDVYFKPSQVIHITPNQNGSIDSIYGKYFEGQSIYLKTTDGLTSFPVKITSVDHSVNKGFIEAQVDGWNSKWFKIEDPEKITEYLTSDIECEIVDDNMRNFLDEFSHDSYPTYSNPGYQPMNVIYDENIVDAYKLPGDPIFVSSNADFVYTRLKWMFNEIVPNRFIDEEHKTHRFIYITNGFINNEYDELKINMINHDFNQTSLPERYPILRDEPNDHAVWEAEIEKFTSEKESATRMEQALGIQRARIEIDVKNAKTVYEREQALIRLDAIDKRIEKLVEKQERMDRYIRQLEKPTTWFNVRSYNAALVYIANGRADKFSPHFVSNIRDLLYTDKVDVFLFDWENKEWLDPSTYDMTTEIVDNVKIDECDDYTTNRVLYTFTITPKSGFQYSNKILVYFSYNSSDVFDDITMNQPTCNVRFKPILSLDGPIDDYNPYENIRIRKHFDGYEKYTVSSDDIHIKRVVRNGKYTYSPTFRVKDITIIDNNGEHTFEDIDVFYVPNKFKNDESYVNLYKPIYNTQIHSEIDSFEEGKEIRLISIDSGNYDGNISDVMFKGITSLDNGNQVITITGSTLPNYAIGSFVCTVFQSDEYDPVGGVITVHVDHTEDDIYGEWVRVPLDYMTYREVPDEFKIVMKEPVTESDTIVILKNNYSINEDDYDMDIHNEGLNDPFTYYYDSKHLVRMPISNVRINEHNERLVIDMNNNDGIHTITAPYIGICRYSAAKIDKSGLVDLTGYLPTPLSRDRYEFWVNGRCVKDPKDLIILSPTSIQLCNMKSLRNFEVIELVDDINTDNDLFKQGNLYMDINGNTYGTYKLALLSNSRIRKQNIRYTFNANTHSNVNDHTKDIITNPNNKDLEGDILSYVTFDDSSTDYNRLYNIPSINGITLFHPKLQDLGIEEILNDDIIKQFDMVWKLEETTNPLFMMTHRKDNNKDDVLKLHIKLITEPHWNGLDIDTTGMYLIYAAGSVDKYFSLYISKTSDGVINDTTNTLKIIPFIMPGTYVLIESKYAGMWLHSTYENTKPIHIVNSIPE